MTVVYVDLLWLLNFMANYLLLLVGGRMAGVLLLRGRMALAAALGAGYAVLLFLPGMEWLSAWPCRMSVGVLMGVLSYGKGRGLLRPTVMFFTASAALGGAVLGAQLLGSGPLTADNRALYSHLDVRLLLVLFALCYFVLSLFFRRAAAHGSSELVELRMELLGQEVNLSVLRDTGNTLTDPATNRPVVVVEFELLAHLLPPEIEPSRPVDGLELLSEVGIRGGRLLPYRAVGTEWGLLLALRTDRVWANGKNLGPLLVALSPGPVSDGGGYHGLIGGM